jgi:hypothetical protein
MGDVRDTTSWSEEPEEMRLLEGARHRPGDGIRFVLNRGRD